MQVLTLYFESSMAHVIKISEGLNVDFKWPHLKLEICRKSHQIFITQKR